MAVAPTDLTVLISGESGVGKEMIPRIIHQNSLRRNGKYFAVNCGGIPEGTINSELFGHEKGSFTGATETRKGYFEEANGGTLFLDEVGELPMSTQVMLLRVLQNGEYIKVGSSKVEKTDVRVVAATNVNLMYAVAQGKFREDLYYRLNAIQIRMPALRDRKDDIYLLFRKFTSDFSEKYRVCKIALTHDGIIALRNYRWPGNIRQLKNVAETVSALESVKLTPGAERLEIDAETLRKYLPKEEENVLPAIAGSQGSAFSEDEKKMLVKAILDLRQEVDQLKMAVYSGHQPAHRLPAVPVREEPEAQEPEPYEEADWQEPETQEQSPAPAPDLSLQKVSEDLIQKALEKHNGNRKLAAAELGISERTLYRRLSKEMKK
jgi:transcriptional regulator with PAS, ATPase and Fis domain